MSKTSSVYGIGNPLMDLVSYKDYDFLKELNVKAGTMTLLTESEMFALLDKVQEYKKVPGGSCANTLRGMAWLSKHDQINPLIYNGCVGQDPMGKHYRDLLETECGIKALIEEKELATGVSIIIVTPDYERTMFTYLGACRGFEDNHVNLDYLAESEILHFNGYMWDTDNQKAALLKAFDFARENGIRISFDLADPFVVQRYREDFIGWLKKVDVVFGNLEEFSLLTGIENKPENIEQIVKEAGKYTSLAVVKAGAAGSYVNHNGEIHFADGIKVKAVDTVGAGDSYASGFLYSFLKGVPHKESISFANKVAANIVAVEGCDFNQLNHADVF